MTERAAHMLVGKLQAMGHDRAIAAIKHSISMDWKGVYEERAGSGKAARPKANYATDELV